MRIHEISILALACAVLGDIGFTPIANAQNIPLVCYRVTGLPPLPGIVTKAGTELDENEAEIIVQIPVEENESFDFPPDLVYTAPSTPGEYSMTYDLLQIPHSCSVTTTLFCDPNSAGINDPNPVCGPLAETCVQAACVDSNVVLDSATITFNIIEGDACEEDGRDSNCEPNGTLPQ